MFAKVGWIISRPYALWKCMMQLDAMNMDDVVQIILEHTNPSSHLANLGQQRLATDLDKAQEGAQCDYVF